MGLAGRLLTLLQLLDDLQMGFTDGIPVKTVSGIAKDFARLCYAAKLAAQLQKSQFRFDDF